MAQTDAAVAGDVGTSSVRPLAGRVVAKSGKRGAVERVEVLPRGVSESAQQKFYRRPRRRTFFGWVVRITFVSELPTGPGRLSRPARKLLADTAHELMFSTASLWEVTIKKYPGPIRAI